MDIANGALLTIKFALTRAEIAFHLIPTDERLDARGLRQIKVEDLKRYGRSEILIVELSMKTNAEQLLPHVKKLLGPFGQAAALGQRLRLLDNVETLRRALPRIDELERERRK